MKNNEHQLHAAKNFIGFMVVAIAAVMFFAIFNFQEELKLFGEIRLVVVLAIIGGGLLIGLFYLVSNARHQSPGNPTKSPKSKKRKK